MIPVVFAKRINLPKLRKYMVQATQCWHENRSFVRSSTKNRPTLATEVEAARRIDQTHRQTKRTGDFLVLQVVTWARSKEISNYDSTSSQCIRMPFFLFGDN